VGRGSMGKAGGLLGVEGAAGGAVAIVGGWREVWDGLRGFVWCGEDGEGVDEALGRLVVGGALFGSWVVESLEMRLLSVLFVARLARAEHRASSTLHGLTASFAATDEHT
jgi:hypothetical protein